MVGEPLFFVEISTKLRYNIIVENSTKLARVDLLKEEDNEREQI